MALPTLTKTWQFNVNNLQAAQGSRLADDRQFLLNIKNALLGFGTNPWTVRYSCDGTTAGTAGDGVDRWSAQNKVIFSSGGAHSWIVLQQSGINTGFQVLLDCNSTTSAASTGLTIKVSPSAGFTGGTTSVAPTATDSHTPLSNTTFLATNDNVDRQLRWNVMQSTDGQLTLVFAYISGVGQMLWTFSKLANATAAGVGGTVGYDNTGLWSLSNTGVLWQTLVTRQQGTNVTCSFNYETNTQAIVVVSDLDGNFPMLPLAASSATSPARGRLGTFQDLWITCATPALGDTFPNDSSDQFILPGNSTAIVIPWNGTTLQTT
jgi:hypothetical protein